MFLAKKLNNGAGSPAAPVDAQFNYVTMLLHGDGTNGAQNNTFLDSSSNNFTITRNGNTTQGSFSPYGSNWSNYFNGSSTLSLADNAVFTLPADFTIEFWFFQTGAFQDRLIIDKWTEYYVYTRANGVIGLAWGPYNPSGMFGVGGIVQSGSNGFALNTWTHVAAVRNSNTFTLYINGVSVSTATNSATVTDTSAGITIGDYGGGGGYAFEGYVSNARIVKGTAVYTANFTPSTTPLTAISGTSFLTCQSNRFIDNSTNAFAITANGSPSVQRFNPFGTSTAYSTSVIGGSGYFDDDGDTLSCTGTIPSTADFTLSLWVYPTSLSGYAYTVRQAGGGNTFYLTLGYANGTVDIQVGNSSYADYTAGVYKAGQWNYVQVVKQSSAYSVYVNGTALSVYGSAGTIGTVPISSGTLTLSYNVGSYFSDVRIVTSALANSVPTAPLTAVSGTTMLLSMKNAAIFDNAMMNDLETAGNAQISTSVVKYGTGSVYINSASAASYLTSFNKDAINFGTGDLTIEAWIYPTQYTDDSLICKFVTGGNVFFVMINGGKLTIVTNGYSGGLGYSYLGNLSLNTWSHIAVTRVSGTWFGYVNGTKSGSSYSFATAIVPNQIIVGEDSTNRYIGYIDDFRITKGLARYTTTFTPPTAAFSDTGPY